MSIPVDSMLVQGAAIVKGTLGCWMAPPGTLRWSRISTARRFMTPFCLMIRWFLALLLVGGDRETWRACSAASTAPRIAS